MMFINTLRQSKEVLLIHKKLIITFLLYLIIILILNDLYNIRINQFYQTEYTFADVMIKSNWYGFFPVSVVIFTVIVESLLLRNDFSADFILRQKSKQSMWLVQVRKILVVSFLFVVVFTLMVITLGFTAGNKYINFTEDASVFRLATRTVLDHNPSIISVIFMCLVTAYFSIVIMSMIVILSKWVFNNYLAGILIIISICWIDSISFFKGFKIFFGTNSAYYNQWLDEPRMLLNLIFPVIYASVVIITGIFVSNRKDFLNVQQK